MTKTLTEQLNNGTLKDGLYYIKDNDNIFIGLRYSLHMTQLIDDGCSSFEVLAPIPSYDEYRKLKEQLRIATKALKEYSVNDNWFMEDSEGKCWSFNKQYPWRIGFKALKEMEGVK